MINFAIPATGSSGHIGGGILLAGLLGGFPAFLSIAAVLIIQCLFFADGGLLALGCNIFNIGAVPCLLIYPLVFKPFLRGGIGYRRLTLASVSASVLALEIGAFCVVIQTTLSGITALPFGAFSALMLPIHLVIGLVEGIVTAAVLCFIYKMRPEIIESSAAGERLGGVSTKKALIALAVITVAVGGVLSIFASANPDGLEWAVGKTAGNALGGEAALGAGGAVFDEAASIQEGTAFLPDYAFAANPDDPAGAPASGLIGAGITFAIAGAAGFVINKTAKRKRAGTSG